VEFCCFFEKITKKRKKKVKNEKYDKIFHFFFKIHLLFLQKRSMIIWYSKKIF